MRTSEFIIHGNTEAYAKPESMTLAFSFIGMWWLLPEFLPQTEFSPVVLQLPSFSIFSVRFVRKRQYSFAVGIPATVTIPVNRSTGLNTSGSASRRVICQPPVEGRKPSPRWRRWPSTILHKGWGSVFLFELTVIQPQRMRCFYARGREKSSSSCKWTVYGYKSAFFPYLN